MPRGSTVFILWLKKTGILEPTNEQPQHEQIQKGLHKSPSSSLWSWIPEIDAEDFSPSQVKESKHGIIDKAIT